MFHLNAIQQTRKFTSVCNSGNLMKDTMINSAPTSDNEPLTVPTQV